MSDKKSPNSSNPKPNGRIREERGGSNQSGNFTTKSVSPPRPPKLPPKDS